MPRVHAILRACHELAGTKPRPAWFDKAAFFRRVAAEADGLTVVWDSSRAPPPAYLSGFDVRAAPLGSDLASLIFATTDVFPRASLDDEDIVYFVEDDYLHRRGWAAALREAFAARVADYVTLYDHPDKYDVAMYRGLGSRVLATAGGHWRSAPSTTNTWAVRAGTLRRDMHVHLRYLRPELGHCIDHEKFLSLWDAGRSLASRLPALSTHAQSDVLAPAVDWEAELERVD